MRTSRVTLSRGTERPFRCGKTRQKAALGSATARAGNDYDRRNQLTHLKAYRHRPAIAFQSGADDKIVPSDGATRFVEQLKPIYGKEADRLVVNLQPNTAHCFTPEMLENSLRWFQTYLK